MQTMSIDGSLITSRKSATARHFGTPVIFRLAYASSTILAPASRRSLSQSHTTTTWAPSLYWSTNCGISAERPWMPKPMSATLAFSPGLSVRVPILSVAHPVSAAAAALPKRKFLLLRLSIRFSFH